MAAMTPMKRKMSSTRAAKRSRYTKLIPTVVDAITEAESLPAGVRTLLKTSLPIVLNIDKADRHAYEAEVVGQAQQALGIVQNALEQEHAAAMSKQNVVIAPAEEARRHAAKKSAEEHLEAAKGQLEASKAAKKACEKSEEEAGDAMKAAQKEAKTADKALQGLVGKREHLTSSLANEFVALREGSIAGAAAKKAIHELLSIGKQFGMDSTLLQILPMACKKQVASRTEFEIMVFTSLESLIQQEIATLGQSVAEAEAVAAAKAGDVAVATGALENAKTALNAAADDLTAAHAAHKEAGKEVVASDAHVRSIWDDMRKLCDAQDSLAEDLKNIKENVWAAFNQLKEKEPEPEPVEEPVEEAAPEAATDAPMEAAQE